MIKKTTIKIVIIVKLFLFIHSSLIAFSVITAFKHFSLFIPLLLSSLKSQLSNKPKQSWSTCCLHAVYALYQKLNNQISIHPTNYTNTDIIYQSILFEHFVGLMIQWFIILMNLLYSISNLLQQNKVVKNHSYCIGLCYMSQNNVLTNTFTATAFPSFGVICITYTVVNIHLLIVCVWFSFHLFFLD